MESVERVKMQGKRMMANTDASYGWRKRRRCRLLRQKVIFKRRRVPFPLIGDKENIKELRNAAAKCNHRKLYQ